MVEGLKEAFSHHGIPETLVSDNMPFNSHEFHAFTKLTNTQQITSSPGYAQSNGQAERAIQTVKNLMRKSDNIWLALLEYRNSPIAGCTFTPAQILMGRALRSIIPVMNENLQPCTIDPQMQLKVQKNRQKFYYDRGAKPQEELKEGEIVRIRRDRHWYPAQVINKAPEPRSYWVQHNGTNLRRNRRHLLQTGETVYEEQLPPVDTPETVSNQPSHTKPAAETTEPETNTCRTRSGRAVVRPAYLKDYV